jgi:hypothetical protein
LQTFPLLTFSTSRSCFSTPVTANYGLEQFAEALKRAEGSSGKVLIDAYESYEDALEAFYKSQFFSTVHKFTYLAGSKS